MYTEEHAREWFRAQEQEKERLQREAQARRDEEAAQKKAEALALIARRKEAFEAHVASFGPDAEAALASQAQMLHGVFAHALEEYVGSASEEDRAKLYGAIALRAQNYCRMTLSAAAKLKQGKEHTTIALETAKTTKQAIIRSGNEALDSGGACAAGAIDTDMATLAEGGVQIPGQPAGQPV